MEKIERLAHLNPKTEQVSGHSLEMFRLLRGFAILDWTLKHPNDMSQKEAEAKFSGLMEKAWELLSTIQAEVEYREAREADIDPEGESLIVRANG